MKYVFGLIVLVVIVAGSVFTCRFIFRLIKRFWRAIRKYGDD